MKISILSLVLGLIIGVLLLGFLYYVAYKSFDTYLKIRHPLKKSSTELKSPTQPPANKMYISEWMSNSQKGNISNFENFIADGEVYLFDKNGKSIAINETRNFLKVVNFNSTDKLQKWRLYFFKNPNDPYEETEGIIYNAGANKYISFEGDQIVLKDLKEPYTLNAPTGMFNIECIHSSNKISDTHEEFWITSEKDILKTTKNKENAMDFFVAII